MVFNIIMIISFYCILFYSINKTKKECMKKINERRLEFLSKIKEIESYKEEVKILREQIKEIKNNIKSIKEEK